MPANHQSATAPVPGYSEFHGGSAGHAYNEAAFQRFLAIDRRRVERSMHSLLLVLVTVRQQPAGDTKLADDTAVAIFAGLSGCLREADFVGWYREGRVAAAVLAQGDIASVEARQRATERIVDALAKRLSAAQLSNLRVRVVRLGGKVRK